MATVLHGIRVLEQGTFITGPSTSMLLGDLGADVIKVERPDKGDPFRSHGGGLYSPYFQTYNRNKRSITLDTRDAEDLAHFDKLVQKADIYIQNFRPGAAERLNIDYERLKAINPRLIYCSITGFGSDGPSASRPSYDNVAQAASGYLHLMTDPAKPRVVGPAIADSVTGLYAALTILGALHERSRTGKGRKIEISMLEAMCHFNLDAFTHYYSGNEIMGPNSRPSVSQSYVLKCADGKLIGLHMSSREKFWRGLANAINRPTLLDDERFASQAARIANYELLIELLGGIFCKRTRKEWCERLQAQDVPHAPVYDTSDALEDPQARHLQLLVEAGHPDMGAFRTVRFPGAFDGERPLSVTPPPMLGEHRAEIIRQLEEDAEEDPIPNRGTPLS